jgi:hypothetical protein
VPVCRSQPALPSRRLGPSAPSLTAQATSPPRTCSSLLRRPLRRAACEAGRPPRHRHLRRAQHGAGEEPWRRRGARLQDPRGSSPGEPLGEEVRRRRPVRGRDQLVHVGARAERQREGDGPLPQLLRRHYGGDAQGDLRQEEPGAAGLVAQQGGPRILGRAAQGRRQHEDAD